MAKSPYPGLRSETVRKIHDEQDQTVLKLTTSESEIPNAQSGIVKRRVEYISKITGNGRAIHVGTKGDIVRCGCCARGHPGGWFREPEPPSAGICLLESDGPVRCAREGCRAWTCARHQYREHTADGVQMIVCRDCHERWDLWRILRALGAAITCVFFRREEV